MYLPRQFDRSNDRDIAQDIVRDYPLATLISNDDDGVPFVTHLPLHWLADQREPAVLLGHVAKANPHWRYLSARPGALAVFVGPNAYMSPAVYPDLERVPTWNYIAVHAKVSARLIEGPERLDALLKQLIQQHEPPFARQWRGLDPAFQAKLLGAIVGFELVIDQLSIKVKLNQHRPEAQRQMLDTYDTQARQGSEQALNLARWIRRIGQVR